MKRNHSHSEPAASGAMPARIGFRLDEESRRRLEELAQAKNVSMHQYAHYLIVDSLYSREKAARDDRNWLAKATDALHQYGRNKRARRSQGGSGNQ